MIRSLVLVSQKHGKTNKKPLFTHSKHSFTLLAYIYLNIVLVYNPPNLSPNITRAASLYILHFIAWLYILYMCACQPGLFCSAVCTSQNWTFLSLLNVSNFRQISRSIPRGRFPI